MGKKMKDRFPVKILRFPIPKPKQRGWQFLGIQGNNLVYIRRKWTKRKETADGKGN